MRDRELITTLVCALTILVAGCDFQSEGAFNPSAPSSIEITPVLRGTWTTGSAAASSATTTSSGLPSPESCTELEWTISEQNGNFYSGEFKVTCGGGVTLVGTASGTYIDHEMNITAAGAVEIPGASSCSFTLNGTARVENGLIEINYSGNTCFGTISGSEVLTRD